MPILPEQSGQGIVEPTHRFATVWTQDEDRSIRQGLRQDLQLIKERVEIRPGIGVSQLADRMEADIFA
jgi:hypothetical protein